jgi:hypothetical protein
MDASETAADEKKPQKKENMFLGWFNQFIKKFGAGLHDPRFVVELLALAGLVFYVCETRRTNNLTQEALSDERKHFIESERSLVGVVSVEVFPNIEATTRLKARLNYGNYGRSPAIIDALDMDAEVRDTPVPEDATYSEPANGKFRMLLIRKRHPTTVWTKCG